MLRCVRQTNRCFRELRIVRYEQGAGSHELGLEL
jgi:hypothetical protein